ncbi:MAG: DUF202 domain-containing protein [Bacteroidota bacterium]
MAKSDMLLRDHLAVDRTRLANQRTLLSFLRTGLYLFVTALAVMKVDFLASLAWIGWLCIFLGVVVMGIGMYNYRKVQLRILRSYE